MIAALAAIALGGGLREEIRILFLGNSHTTNHSVPGMVQALGATANRRITYEVRTSGFVEEQATRPETMKLIAGGRWTFVVLQGAKLSSSHKYRYSHEGAVQLAKHAKKSGAKVLYFAEWPRKGWDETGYILREYGEIVKAGGGEVMPIPKAFDGFRKQYPAISLWDADGNHSSLAGAYLASLVIHRRVSSPVKTRPTWRPNGLDEKVSRFLVESAWSIQLR